jgi:serine/threonine protein kinase
MDAESTLRNVEQLASPATNRFEVGQILDGKFEILSLLGRGGMGSVYRAKHLLLNMEVALKTLDTERLNDATSSRRFQTEAKAAFSLKHPNLVKVHDYGVLEDGHPFFVMELVKGKTLQALIKERGPLSLQEIAAIFPQICFGLAHAHEQQVVHRDMKPANIMIVDGIELSKEGSVKILDFGIAKIVGVDRGEMQTLTQTGEIFGSPSYMSPEQCSGGAIDQRSDVYSVGCVLFEALTGTPPFSGTNALRTMMQHVSDPAPSLKEAALGAEFPEAIEQIVKRMLAKSPADRYSEMGVVAHDLYVVCGRPESSNADTVQTTKRLKESVSAPKSTNISLTYLQLGAAIFATILVSVLGTLLYEQFNVREVTPSSEEIDSMKKLESSLKGAPKAWSLITNPTADAAVLVHRK